MGFNELHMPDLWKEMSWGAEAVEEYKGLSIWCELVSYSE